MKKILFLIPDLQFGGAEKVLVNLANNMDRLKYDVTIQTIFDTGVHRKRILPHVHYKPGFRWQFRGNSHLIRAISPRVLYNFFIKDEYDVVIAYLEGSATRIVSGCNHPNVKLISWIHIEFNGDNLLCLGFKDNLSAQEAYMKFDRIVCVSNTVKKSFLSTIGIELPQCTVLYNTNETEQILALSKEQVDDVYFNPNEINICSVAKIVPSKGYDRLARVHNRLIKEGYTVHIYLLGVGDQKKEIEDYLETEGLTDSFTFIGFKENPYKYVAACDLYVCSSRKEGFSTAVTEALIVGTPVVSTCCSGAYELLGNNNEFGIVTENSEEGIYFGIKKIIDDKSLRAHYKKMAIERGKKFSTKNTVQAVEEMIDSL